MILANLSNGLVFPHDMVCNFQSNHGHHKKLGYFRIDAMPYTATIHLLQGGEVTIVDASLHQKALTDAQKYGVTTWCLVFNRALKLYGIRVAPWQTRDMEQVANSNIHRQLVHSIRKLVKLYGDNGPAVIGQNVKLECASQCDWDDKPDKIKSML